ncbi:MAG TPA: isocitrate lyase/phosphoenolpyruvate mutase family protein [Opitutus sp.]|nr:isocitrate lyase/phosphoenolpyruvate mutase family protein [Opitutus sp.]
MSTGKNSLENKCERLRALHVRGAPLLLPNAWDAASARAVVAAGFPVVATTSAGVAAALGHADHEHAPRDEMLAAAARIAASVDVPVTIDAEAGYGLSPAGLVAELSRVGAAGCNLEDTDHAAGKLRDPKKHAAWLREVRAAAKDQGYGLVVNARIDVFLATHEKGGQGGLVAEALERARLYFEAGADCVYPITLWEKGPLNEFVAAAPGPVNILPMPRGPTVAELTAAGVARISFASRLHREVMEHLRQRLAAIAEATGAAG